MTASATFSVPGAAPPASTIPALSTARSTPTRNPQFPTQTEVREWINATQSQVTTYEFDRDPVSDKPGSTRFPATARSAAPARTLSSPIGDAANPLLPTQILDGRGLVTQFAYDANGQMTSKSEAVGTSHARTTLWQYGNRPSRPCPPASRRPPPPEARRTGDRPCPTTPPET